MLFVTLVSLFACSPAIPPEGCIPQALFVDIDGDGIGDGLPVWRCTAGEGFVATTGDCDDENALVYPGAVESCDGRDNNCDGETDEGLLQSYFLDEDGDGFAGSHANSGCTLPENAAVTATDCDDGHADVHPGASEVCDGVDQNCDGVADNGAADAALWYLDLDQDGQGDAATEYSSCTQPEGTVENADDCNDQNGQVYVGAVEICDGRDNDCNGLAEDEDPGVVGQPVWYPDADGDGIGQEIGVLACGALPGAVPVPGDCDDTNAGVVPGAVEICDGIDNNCDGLVDDDQAADLQPFYIDIDGDGFGRDDSEIWRCSAPLHYVAVEGDCDDQNDAANPGAPEETDCTDRTDYNCDGMTLYADVDQDGTPACEDCDDTDFWSAPDRSEVCDGIDNNCDGKTDEEGAIGARSFYPDVDGDGYGVSSGMILACDLTVGYAASSTDCEDADAAISPAAADICDGIDNDCSGIADDQPLYQHRWYTDADGDGYGDGNGFLLSCDPLAATAEVQGDCDDSNPLVNPNAIDTCDGIDADCNGMLDDDPEWLWFRDADGDGAGDGRQMRWACSAPVGYIPELGDCDDGDATISPFTVEICDGLDQDCDGAVDNEAADTTTLYLDEDGDGYGGQQSVRGCANSMDGWIVTGSDCNDGEPSVSPAAVEVCDGYDTDCDGVGDACIATGEMDAGLEMLLEGEVWGQTFFVPDQSGDQVDDLLVTVLTGQSVTAWRVVDTQGNNALLEWPVSESSWFEEAASGIDYDDDGILEGVGHTFQGGSLQDDVVFLFSLDLADQSDPEQGAWATIHGNGVAPFYGTTAENGDFDQDGRSELVLAGHDDRSSHIWLFQPERGGEYTPDHAVAEIGAGELRSWPDPLLSADVDGDGSPELWIADSGVVYQFEGPLSGSIALADADRRFAGGEALATAGDVDGDGKEELWVQNEGAFWLVDEMMTSGTIAEQSRAAVEAPTSLPVPVSADFNGDGLTDLSLGVPYTSQQATFGGKIYFFPAPFSGRSYVQDASTSYTGTVDHGFAGSEMTAADLDQDGREDLVAPVDGDPDGALLFFYGSQIP